MSDPYCQCIACESGKTFTANANNAVECTACTESSALSCKNNEYVIPCIPTMDAHCATCGMCQGGYFVSGPCGGDGNAVCSQCPVDHFSASQNYNSSCTACDAGTYASLGSTECKPCTTTCSDPSMKLTACGNGVDATCEACPVIDGTQFVCSAGKHLVNPYK